MSRHQVLAELAVGHTLQHLLPPAHTRTPFLCWLLAPRRWCMGKLSDQYFNGTFSEEEDAQPYAQAVVATLRDILRQGRFEDLGCISRQQWHAVEVSEIAVGEGRQGGRGTCLAATRPGSPACPTTTPPLSPCHHLRHQSHTSNTAHIFNRSWICWMVALPAWGPGGGHSCAKTLLRACC